MSEFWDKVWKQLNRPLFGWQPPPPPPLKPVAEIRDGDVVTVEGRAQPDGETWLLPLTGEEAVCWTWSVVEPSDDSSARQYADDTEFGPRLWVEAEDGARVEVLRKGDGAMYAKPVVLRGKPKGDTRAHLDAFFAHYPVEMHEHFPGFGHGYYYAQRAVPVGARVQVSGKARVEAAAEGEEAAGYREAPRRVVLESGEDAPLVIRVDPD